jgi:hypothetical protein
MCSSSRQWCPHSGQLHASGWLIFYLYHDATKLLEAFIFNIEIPTIACINGPGLHTEFALQNKWRVTRNSGFTRH